MSDEILKVGNSAHKITHLIPNRWFARSIIGGALIIISLT